MARKACAAAGGRVGLDRRRVCERLRAGEAGLQELRLLRDRQERAVKRLLRGNRARAPGDGGGSDRDLRAEPEPDPEQCLALGEKGLEQGIGHGWSGLELALCGGPCPPCDGCSGTPAPDRGGERTLAPSGKEGLLESEGTETEGALDHGDPDSRPSSGFFDASECGGGSVSPCCGSVSSVSSVPPSARAPPTTARCRPHSTDDAASRGPGPGRGRLEGGGGVAEGWRRPVSAGELPSMCRSRRHPHLSDPLPLSLPDPGADLRFSRDLVSRDGGEVYRYPSPLHAVALHSPLFTSPFSPPSPSPSSPPSPSPSSPPSSPSILNHPSTSNPSPASIPSPPPSPNPLPSVLTVAIRPLGPELAPARRDALDSYISGLLRRFRGGGGLRPMSLRPASAPQPRSLSLPSVCPSAPRGGRLRIATSCQASDGPRSLERAWGLGWACPLPSPPPSSLPSPPQLLYRGRHHHRELVRLPQAEVVEDRLLAPQEKGRKAELWQRLSGRWRRASRSGSEMNLSLRPGAGGRPGRDWASLLVIPPPGRDRGSGLLQQARALLGRRHHHHQPSPPPSALSQSLPRLATGSPASGPGFHRSTSFKELRRKLQVSLRHRSVRVNK